MKKFKKALPWVLFGLALLTAAFFAGGNYMKTPKPGLDALTPLKVEIPLGDWDLLVNSLERQANVIPLKAVKLQDTTRMTLAKDSLLGIANTFRKHIQEQNPILKRPPSR